MARRREPLTRARIVETTLALLDEEGLSGVSMRRVAAKLGVEAMSLYNHVTDKQDLLNGVVDSVLGGMTAPDPALPWPDRLRVVALGLYGALVAHPPLVLLLASEQARPTSPEVLRGMNDVVGALAESGLRPEHQVSAYRGLIALVFGFALTHTRGSTTTRGQAERAWQSEPRDQWDADHHPELARIGDQFFVTRPEDDLQFLLGAFLEALAARARAR